MSFQNKTPAENQLQCDTDDGSNKVIQQLQFVLADNVLIKQKLDSLDMLPEQMTTVISSLDQLTRAVNRLSREKERKQAHTNKQRPPSRKGKSVISDVSKLLHLGTALQENAIAIVNSFSFNPSEFPDMLIENECLSEDECKYIRSQTSDKDQVRLLLRKIKARGPETIQLFLEMIEKDQPYLVEGVNKSLQRIIDENKQKPVCGICLMKNSVDLKDIADNLWSGKVISDDVYGDIFEIESMHKHRQYLWNNIIASINGSNDPEAARNILMKSLENKYGHIVQSLKGVQGESLPPCCCICPRRRVARRNVLIEYGSTTDLSTTSEVPVPDFAKIDDYSDSDSLSVKSSFNEYSYENLEKYNDI